MIPNESPAAPALFQFVQTVDDMGEIFKVMRGGEPVHVCRDGAFAATLCDCLNRYTPSEAEGGRAPEWLEQAWNEIYGTMHDTMLNNGQRRDFVLSILKGQLANPPKAEAPAKPSQSPSLTEAGGLVWTKERPTVKGHYMCRVHRNVFYAQAIRADDDELVIFLYDDNYDLAQITGWAGPIPEPLPTHQEGGAT